MPNDGGATWTSYGKAFGSSNSWRTKLWSSIALFQIRSKYARKEQWRRGKQSKEKQGGNQRTASAVFFGTFGALPEVHFLHAIYHFKAQEVKNPTLQTVYDLELKWGRYGLWKTTASSWGIISHDGNQGAKFLSPKCGNFAHLKPRCEIGTPTCEFSPVSAHSTRDLFF